MGRGVMLWAISMSVGMADCNTQADCATRKRLVYLYPVTLGQLDGLGDIEAGTLEVERPQIDTCQIRAAEVCSGQFRMLQICLREIAIPQIRLLEFSPVEVGLDQLDTAEIHPLQA